MVAKIKSQYYIDHITEQLKTLNIESFLTMC